VTATHEQLHAFADGELSEPEAAAFRLHLAACPRCQQELEDVLQLQGLEDQLHRQDHQAPAAPPARAFRPSWDRRRWGLLAATTAAALGLAVVTSVRLFRASSPPDLLAAAGTRTLEARLSYAGAREHRPYSVTRSGDPAAAGAAGANVPLKLLGDLEERGDFHGLAAAQLLRGERDQAAQALARAPRTLDADADRAVVALSRGALEDALALLDRVLEQRPDHGPALWNRALALRELGLPLVAAQAFERVAALAEPGWSAEARLRADETRRQMEASHRAYQASYAAGRALEAGGPPGPLVALARDVRGMARSYLYEATWMARTPDEMRALLPLAREVDGQYGGGDRMQRHVEALAARDFSRRGPLARTVREIFAGTLDPAAAPAFVAQAMRTGNPDVLLALPAAGLLPRHLDDYEAAARAVGDPWFTANAQLVRAQAAFAAGQLLLAEQLALEALATSLREGADVRVVLARGLLGDLYLEEHRLQEAREQASAGLRLARELNDSRGRARFLRQLGDVARYRHAPALTRAYLEERALQPPRDCRAEGYVHESLATLDWFAFRWAEARAQLDRVPECQPPVHATGAFVLADLARVEGRPEDLRRVQAALAALRASGQPPGHLAVLQHIEGVALLGQDRAAGIAALRKAIQDASALPPEDASAAKARDYSYSVLALEAGRAGDHAGALALMSERDGARPPDRCALGVELRDERLLVVAVGPSGALSGAFDAGRRSAEVDVASLVPAAQREALAGCDRVQVIAHHPVHGRAGLLPPEMAWSYRAPRPRPAAAAAAPPPTAGAPRQLLVHSVEPPPSLGLPRLAGWHVQLAPGAGVELAGAAATPARVLAELRDATEVAIHAHGLVNLGLSDASLVALSPGPDGRYALTAAEVRRQELKAAPVVLLGACRAAHVAPYMHLPWSLPLAFLEAGASAVIASPEDIPDREAGPFFDAVLARIRAGAPAATALRDERVRSMARDVQSWTRTVVVFD
jgi:tetratricopeptide (TPR) repeat protein